tara:strand:- start:4438 stop:5991 length:1554 start_codon:yes stop_codon:yes gene_type:complete
MAAIVTDQIRILNAKNFVNEVRSSNNSYYSFVGLPNPTDYQLDWDTNPPSPKDNFDEENNYWDTMIALKKINSSDVRRVVSRRLWSSGTTYDMYRHDYSRTNTAKISGSTSLYSSSYYVLNSDYRVYVCLQNGTDPDNPSGRPSLDEPTFTDLEPRKAGSSGDGYIWKYLYTIKPSDIVKFESTDFIPVPQDWETSFENSDVRNNAVDGSIKIITITSRGDSVGPIGGTQFTEIPISGDGIGAECTIVTNNDRRVESITVSNQGSGYTYGTVDLDSSGISFEGSKPTFDVIISPKGGHGANVYNELGSYNVLLYSRIENDTSNPDFITGNQIARVGLIENPQSTDSTQLSLDKASATFALKLVGAGYSSATFTPDSFVSQTISTGTTSIGRVVSYDQVTGVLKYWQDRTLVGFTSTGVRVADPQYGLEMNEFTSTPGAGGDLTIVPSSGSNLQIDDTFSGISTTINNRTYYLGQEFFNGLSNPEVKKHAGNIIYVDNRPSITRSSNQKEDIKIILQF